MLKSGLLAGLVAAMLAQGARTEFVELDVVALDGQEMPVADLTQADFQVKEDGKSVPLQSFTVVAARGRVDEERSVVLLMDDIGVSSSGTSPMRQIGHFLLSPAQLADDVGVVRLSRLHDEAFGDADSARERVDQYHGGGVPYSSQDTPETVLRTLGRIAEELEPIEHRRKVVICLGPTSVCNVPEPFASSMPSYRELWIAALSAAARANVSMYEVDPTGLSQFSRISGTGLVSLTGGEVLRNSNDFSGATARIWREASRYYLLGYWAAPSSRKELRSIEVTTRRRNLHLRTRRFR